MNLWILWTTIRMMTLCCQKWHIVQVLLACWRLFLVRNTVQNPASWNIPSTSTVFQLPNNTINQVDYGDFLNLKKCFFGIPTSAEEALKIESRYTTFVSWSQTPNFSPTIRPRIKLKTLRYQHGHNAILSFFPSKHMVLLEIRSLHEVEQSMMAKYLTCWLRLLVTAFRHNFWKCIKQHTYYLVRWFVEVHSIRNCLLHRR